MSVQHATGTGRDAERERREQNRYALLERLYLLTGENCDQAVSPAEIEIELEMSAADYLPGLEDLMHLGYVRHAGAADEVCVTEMGIEYLLERAWRRRSIRDEPERLRTERLG